MSIRFFDMFAGIGGFRSGLAAVEGFECVGHCEIDKYANQAYNAIYEPKGEVYFDDARTINPDEMPDIDLICGGFPCQSFSIAGRRGGFTDARGTLFFEIARLAAAKRPNILEKDAPAKYFLSQKQMEKLLCRYTPDGKEKGSIPREDFR